MDASQQLRPAARVVVTECMGIKPGESVLVVTDTRRRELGEVIRQAATEAGAEAVLLMMEPRTNNGEEPPALVAAAMKAAQVVIIPTSRSLSHTRAREEACLAGARISSMPGLTADMMARTLRSGMDGIVQACREMSDWLSQAGEVRVTTPAGTDIRFSICNRRGVADTGVYSEPGAFGNLPAGEAYIAPVEGSAQGVLVIDGSMAGVGKVDVPIRLEVEDGLVGVARGGQKAADLEAILNRYGRAARNIAELGVGLNPHAILTGATLEDEKVLGTVHIALGDNSHFGGTVAVESHLDGVMLNPTLELDGTVVIRDGQLIQAG